MDNVFEMISFLESNVYVLIIPLGLLIYTAPVWNLSLKLKKYEKGLK